MLQGDFKMKRMVAALFLAVIAVPVSAAPGDMSVAAFLAKADALRAKGPMALFSSDISVLRSEATAGGRAYRARLATERAHGTPSSCPPARSSMNQQILMAHLHSYPAAARAHMSMTTAMADWFVRTYPCPR